MRTLGVGPERQTPGEPILFGIFNLFGENYPSMLVSRQMARAARGWDRSLVREAAAVAAVELEERVLPYARLEIEHHHAENRLVVMATTTPHDLAEPLAERLGIDVLIATKFGHRDGVYDGTLDGEFIWGKGKAAEVRRWADRETVDLDQSYAYSDSYYDVPLLSSVGHPNAVNPDLRLAAVAALRRWPIRSFDAPPGVPKVVGLEPQTVAMLLARSTFTPGVRYKTYGLRRIPETGPAIIVGNHRSYFDPLAMATLLAQRGRPVRFLGKKEVFDAPVVGDIAKAMGGIRVDRGTGSDAPLAAAEDALAAGELVAMMPQGTIPRGREFFNPVLKGRYGAARLAAATGAPVIPVGLWGTEHVWPRSSRMPNLTRLLDPYEVIVRVGPEVELGRTDLDADTEAIMSALSRLLPPESRIEREPTEEELARTFPPGYSPDEASDEADRRPGTD